MSANQILQPYPLFTDNSGSPLDAGYIYVGVANNNPETTPVQTYWDEAMTLPAPQPLRTSNGIIYRNGSPAKVYCTEANHSVTVRDKKKTLVIYNPSVSIFISAALVSADDGSSGSVFTTVQGFISKIISSLGSSIVGFIQAGANAVARTVGSKLEESISVLDFGAVGDGVHDDTAAIQAAIDAAATSKTRKVRVPYGAAGVYKLTGAVFFNTGGVTMEWDNNSIVFKKFYGVIGAVPPGYGNLIVVNADYITLINPGIDGNGANYGGSGIAYNRSDTYFTFGCRIENPRIVNTRDSCVVFFGPRGAPDIVIEGGSMTTWQDPSFSGTSSSGFPAIRVIGASDAGGGTSPRVFHGITASTTILLDYTGMNCTKTSDCFTGTLLFGGNPDVTGIAAPAECSLQNQILNTYVRDGLNIQGQENTVDSCLSHGHAPLTWTAYGGKPATYSSYGWEVSSNTQLCKLGPNNVVTQQIIDKSPQGGATGLLSSSYSVGLAFGTQWEGSVSNPSIGNGSIYCEYDNVGLFVNFRMTLTFGTTTTRGSGDWFFSLPRWCITATPAVGNWAGYLYGIGRVAGTVVLSSTGGTHKISLLAADGSTVIGSASPASIPAGSVITIQFFYLRG